MLPTWKCSALLFLGVVTQRTSAMKLPAAYSPSDLEALELPPTPGGSALDDNPQLKSSGLFPAGVSHAAASRTDAAPASAAPASGKILLNDAGWTVTVDSETVGHEGQKAIDGDSSTYWYSDYTANPTQSHQITIDLKSTQNVSGVAYLPRQDGDLTGSIRRHKIYLSLDDINFGEPVAFGTYFGGKSQKVTPFEPQPARYVRLRVPKKNGKLPNVLSAAEIHIYGASYYNSMPKTMGQWGATIDFPVVPVAATVEHDTGKVLVWSAWAPDTFGSSPGSQTATASFDPLTLTVTRRTVKNTNHDMFCPGLSTDFTGHPVVTGGNNAPRMSIFDPSSNAWSSGPDMALGRGYHASVTISDGRTFVIGGSWSGGRGGKDGEIYDPSRNVWTRLPNCLVAPMLTNDASQSSMGDYRRDNHGWLFGWKGGNVFQAGPSKAMNWYGTSGTGSVTSAGSRAADDDAMCGNAVMFDATKGKILTAGGATSYSGATASTNAHVITLGDAGSTPTVTKVGSLSYARTFGNAIVLPNGQVFFTGGQLVGAPFSDAQAILTPELFDPATNTFTKMAPNSVPRTYHSIGLLMIDGTVISGGGGLCGKCDTNHFDAQIFIPPYLFKPDGSRATRPVIQTVSSASVILGGSLTVTTNVRVGSMSLVRFGSNTHSVNTDQRRIPLTPALIKGHHTYSIQIPADAGVAIPGYWMLFALDLAGVPSIATTILIKAS